LRDAEVFIKESVNPETLAQLHLIKGDCLMSQKKYEEALNAYLRVNVFYGSNPKYIPMAQLGAVRAFRGMNSPANKHLKLEDVANQYLNDIISQYPLTKEAEIAKTMLPKEDREKALKKADSAADAAATIAEETGGGS